MSHYFLLIHKHLCIFVKNEKKSSIADALPFPDAIDEPENLTANLTTPGTKHDNDENVISNLISALSTHSRPPLQSGLNSFEIEDSFDQAGF